MSFPIPPNENRRLQALRSYRILNTQREVEFDGLTLLASTICETPISILTLVDEDRQWFKSKVGIEADETPREHAFCAHTILGTEVMVVEDAARDERFAANPLVLGNPHIRFYAGAPLVDREGCALGSLCVISPQPRGLDERKTLALRALARQAIALIEARKVAADLAEALEETRALRGLLPICAYCKGVRDDHGYWSSIEDYLSQHSDVDFSHCLCPKCMKEKFPKTYARLADAQ